MSMADGGQTASDPSAWTIDSLREHFAQVMALQSLRHLQLMEQSDRRYEQRFEAQEKATRAALESADRAVNKAETAAEKRFESVNEFRQSLADQTRGFLPRTEYDGAHTAVTKDISLLTSRLDRIEARTLGINASWLYLVAFVSLISAVIAIVSSVTT